MKCKCCNCEINRQGGGHMVGCIPHKDCKGKGCDDCYGGRYYVEEDDDAPICQQCWQSYRPTGSEDDGFCSDYCAEQFDKELMGEQLEEDEK